MSTQNYVQKLYTCLKDKYGVSDSEQFYTDEPHSKELTVQIPGIVKKTKDHKILIRMEDNENVLLIGEKYPTDDISWSRIIDIKVLPDYHYLAYVHIIPLGNDYDFEKLRRLLNLIEEFNDYCSVWQ